MTRTLPDFYHPPAIETALGVRFTSIPRWNVFHYGLLLQAFREDYPKQELRPPFGNVMIQIPSTDTDFAGMPVRCWFINQESTELIQVQNDCFLRNWRKTENSQEHMHYEFTRPRFEHDWLKFVAFLKEHDLALPEIWQCEVTYINHFVRGHEWDDFNNLSKLYPVWKGLDNPKLLTKSQMVQFATSYQLANDLTLQFISQPAIRQQDGAEIIQLSVTALGRPRSSDIKDVLAWLDDGHAAVVDGFSEFTSDDAHAIWGKK
jgi:uncharacterized protein (TIGR04255 family)